MRSQSYDKDDSVHMFVCLNIEYYLNSIEYFSVGSEIKYSTLNILFFFVCKY